MTINNENNDWKNEAPYLAGLPVSAPFLVPAAYFDGLELRIFQSVFMERLKAHVKEGGFAVPDFYFDHLKQETEAKTTLLHLKSRIPQEESFLTPESYFDNLTARILHKVSEEESSLPKETKIVRLWHSDLVKYATAACIILIAATGLFFNQQHRIKQNGKTELANEQLLYEIDENTIIDHLESKKTLAVKPASATDTEIENYILNNYSASDLIKEL